MMSCAFFSATALEACLDAHELKPLESNQLEIVLVNGTQCTELNGDISLLHFNGSIIDQQAFTFHLQKRFLCYEI